MKKKVFALLLCVGLALPHAHAQLTVGAKAGLNVASISDVTFMSVEPSPDISSFAPPPKLDYAYLPGAHLGGYARYDFSRAFGLQTELLYSQMGYKINLTNVDYGGTVYGDATARMRLHYFNLPILFRLTLPGTGLHIEAGPQPGVLLGNSASLHANSGDRIREFDGNAGPSATRFDLSGLAGIGYRLRNGLAFSAHYVHEFKTSEKEFIPRLSRKYAFQFSVAYDIKTF